MGQIKKILTHHHRIPTTPSSMENQNLCEACQAIFANADENQSQNYRHTLGGFEESATNGCHFCAMRWDRLSLEQRSTLVQHEHRIEVQYIKKRRTLNEPMLRFYYALEREGEEVRFFSLLPRVAKLDFALVQFEGRLATLETLHLIPRDASALCLTSVYLRG